MRIHRVHAPRALAPGQEILLEGSQAHYLGRVLRVGNGQSIVLFNGDGHDYAAEVLQVERGGVAVAVRSRLPGLPEPACRVTVVQAVSRGERMDQTLQKCTELGAFAFQPLLSERVEVRLTGAKRARRLAHWQGVVVSACEQSGRSLVPEVREPRDMQGWLDGPSAGPRLVLAPGAESDLATVVPGQALELAVGPEGGFSDAELRVLEAAGVQPVSMGPRILRTETAAPGAVAVIQALERIRS